MFCPESPTHTCLHTINRGIRQENSMSIIQERAFMKNNKLFDKFRNLSSQDDPLSTDGNQMPENDLDDADLEIINLDEDLTDDDYDGETPKTGIFRFLNVHTLLLAVIVFVVVICVVRLKNWGVMIDLDEIFKDGPGTYEDTLDEIVPLLDANSQPIIQDNLSNIVVFGNSPFADDRDSEDGLANMLANLTGANVYNCAIGDSKLACEQAFFNVTEHPEDVFSLFYLSCLAVGYEYDAYFSDAKRNLTEINEYPKDADEVIETLTTLDFNTVDAIIIMYDATDYFELSTIYNADNSEDITTFTGNLELGIAVLQSVYPDIRIIVASPTYAFAINEEGNHVSSDQYAYNGHDVLSSYVIREGVSSLSKGVSFLDNFYGTFNENNAEKYLTDNLHLNKAGRELVAKRCDYFLNYYIKGYGDSE